MFNPERILGHLVRSSLRGAVHEDMSWASKAGLGMGILGVAMAAFEHFSEQSAQTSGPPGAAGPPPVPPPLPRQATGTPPVAAMMSPPPVPPPLPASVVAPVAPPVQPPAHDDGPNEPAMLLIRAMIAAASADGELDAQERSNILRAAEENGLSDEDRAFLQHELDRPWSLRQIADHAGTPDLRKQIYVASRLAITVDNESERRYLQALSVALYLTTEEVAQLEAKLGE